MKKRNSGAALVIVMCVMFLVVALSLALLRSAAILVQNPVRDNQREQCRINAVSVSEVIAEEIEAYLYDEAEGEEVSVYPESNLKDLLAMAAAGKWKTGEKLRYRLQTDRLPGETWLEFYVLEEDEETVLYMEVGSTVGKESCSVVNQFMPVYQEDDSDPASDRTEEIEETEKIEEIEETGNAVWKWRFLGREWGEEEE